MKTEDLIVELARDAVPVQRLRHPWLRASVWVSATTAYLAAVAMAMASPDRLIAAFGDLRFTLEQLAAALIGLTAGAAALALVIPGNGRRVLIAPVGACVLWIAIVAIDGAQDLLRYGQNGIPLQTDWPCVVAIVMVGALPAAGLIWMLRRGAPLSPRMTLLLAALSAAALANVIACLVRPHDTSFTVLLWHGATIVSLCGLGSVLGPSMLKWTLVDSHHRIRRF
jgi:hypothetical protein